MPLKNHLFIALGFISLALAVVGVFIPLLPTTPFLLLSAGLFFRGSQKLYHWLTAHKIFGEYIRNFREHKAILLSTKIFAVATLWTVMLITGCMAPGKLALARLVGHYRDRCDDSYPALQDT